MSRLPEWPAVRVGVEAESRREQRPSAEVFELHEHSLLAYLSQSDGNKEMIPCTILPLIQVSRYPTKVLIRRMNREGALLADCSPVRMTVIVSVRVVLHMARPISMSESASYAACPTRVARSSYQHATSLSNAQALSG